MKSYMQYPLDFDQLLRFSVNCLIRLPEQCSEMPAITTCQLELYFKSKLTEENKINSVNKKVRQKKGKKYPKKYKKNKK